MLDHEINCQYQDPEGCQCPNQAHEQRRFCFWHDPSINKNSPDIKYQLEQYVQAGGFTRGIYLQRCDLSGVDLVNHHNVHQGYDFSYANFYRSNLRAAHLFHINLTHADLMKADLRHARLNRANLQDANLLGIRWQESKIEGIQLGKKLRQQKHAKLAITHNQQEQAIDYWQQAEEIYRDLRKHAEHEGMFTLAGSLIQRELTMRRYQLPFLSRKRFFSKLIDMFCGYGEEPARIVIFSLLLITTCALLYAFTGLHFDGEVVRISSTYSWQQNVMIFASTFYYSVVTFTTLGYGDFTPVGISRAIAAIEAFTGSFTMALFVVVFVKKMTR